MVFQMKTHSRHGPKIQKYPTLKPSNPLDMIFQDTIPVRFVNRKEYEMTKKVSFDMLRCIIGEPRILSHKANYKSSKRAEDLN